MPGMFAAVIKAKERKYFEKKCIRFKRNYVFKNVQKILI